MSHLLVPHEYVPIPKVDLRTQIVKSSHHDRAGKSPASRVEELAEGFAHTATGRARVGGQRAAHQAPPGEAQTRGRPGRHSRTSRKAVTTKAPGIYESRNH